jgi:tetraacyldisaccharide 4'-kinase
LIHLLIAQSWWRRGSLLTFLLMPLSLLYYLIITLRRGLYRLGIFNSFRPNVPVIVVGNFTVGGTGKTPIVIALAKALQAKGYIPGIVTRGYRRNIKGDHEVSSTSKPDQAGDEPLLIYATTGACVYVSADRARAAKALQNKVNVIISDDGLQHFALQRDVQWAVTDHRRHGNGWLLPAGPLREPARPVDAVLVSSGTVQAGEWAIASQLGDAYLARDRQQQKPLAEFHTQGCAAVAGIGEPERFFEALRQRGVKLSHRLALPDHHDYVSNPFSDIKAEVIFITEKDAIKCAQMDERLWVVPLVVQLPKALLSQTFDRLNRLSTSTSSSRSASSSAPNFEP